MALLEVEDLDVRFYTEDGVVKAVNDLSYQVEAGEKFGVVGESGAGKSVTSLSLMRLIEKPGRIENGEIRFKGRNLLDLDDEEMRRLRGDQIAMIFQDAETALNPVYTVGEQIAEAVRLHLDLDDEQARERAIEMLERVGIPDASDRYSDYPHQFSGGMQQRAVIAIALSCDPDLLICDEPTTALDVTIEAQILELLDDLATEFDTAIQIITHDLGVIADICDRVMVMYAGHAVETAPVEDLYYDPKHPYTVGLMGSIPRIGDESERLQTIPGRMPDLIEMPPGCTFHPRCPYAEQICTQKEPPLVDAETGRRNDPSLHDQHTAACLEYTGDLAGGLDYRVEVREDDVEERRAADGSGKADGGDPGTDDTTSRRDGPDGGDRRE